MQISVLSTLTLYHDSQFWIGIAERVEDGRLTVARIVFGPEPSNEEVLQLVLSGWNRLHFSGEADANADAPALSKNPKRRQREAARELSKRGPSTKSQDVLARARELQKAESKSRGARAKHEAESARFEKRQAKKREKRRGH